MKYKEIDGIFYPDIEAGVDPLIIPGMYAR